MLSKAKMQAIHRPIECCRNTMKMYHFYWLKSHIPKFLLIMRLTVIILIFSLMQVSAATFGQHITLKENRISLEKAFKEIRKQTGYNILLSSAGVSLSTQISANFNREPLAQVMEKLLAGLPLTYTLEQKTVIIKAKEKSFVEKVVDYFAAIEVSGRVVDEKGEPIAGATIRIKGTNTMVIADAEGRFTLKNVAEDAVIEIISLGYTTCEVKAVKELGNIKLGFAVGSLSEVQVVNTGYQSLPKERATGSFVLVDSALLNRSVGTNLLDRLDGVTSSLIFNKNTNAVGFNESAISIRGRSTILGDPKPLIVLDNFPFEGDLGSINPNDIVSVTVLRDAAAASIWGTKAGNGVIVITTRSGKFNQKAKVSFSQNMSIGQKPLLHSQPHLSSREYVEVEQYLFDRGRFDATINNGYGALSPAVEIMLLYRQQQIDLGRRNQMLDSLSSYNVFEQYLDAFYRVPVNQQYQMDISGGGSGHKYYISGGFDRNLESRNINNLSRKTLNINNTYGLFNNRLTFGIGLQLSNTTTKTGPANSPQFPYEHIMDFEGRSLPVTDGVLGLRYVGKAEALGLQDWYYRPLDENKANNTVDRLNVRINNSFSATITKQLKLSGNYMYQQGEIEDMRLFKQDSYYTRNMINTYSVINPLNAQVQRPFLLGDILNAYEGKTFANYGRLQLVFDNGSLSDHQLSGLMGAEVSDNSTIYRANTVYGYDPDLGTNGNQGIDFSKNFINFYSGATGRIPTGQLNGGTIDRYLSYYANAAYTYKGKYTLSGSARKDESNIFGVKSNQKGVPLWSIGSLWEVTKEPFMEGIFLDVLKLRATYGFNGNVDKSTSAYLTANPSSTNNRWGMAQATISNPPNPSLIWEQVRNINIGLEAHMLKGRIKFNGEIYRKDGMHLIGLSPIAPQTGISVYKGNSANLKTRGMDLTVNVQALDGQFKWNSNILLSLVKDEVVQFNVLPGTNYDIVSGNFRNPLVGYPYNAQFSFRYGGLDQTGSPKGYIGNTESNNYTLIRNSSDREGLVYHGSGSPTAFGSILNSFSWKGVTFSFNVIYKGGYWLRRNSLDNTTLFNGGFMIPDYDKRWKAPGDEQFTYVPALTYPVVANRVALYKFSEVLVVKGDHLRLQDIRADIDLRSIFLKKSLFDKLGFFIHAGNIGLLWKANKEGLDPDSPTIAQTNITSFGFRGTF